jgi:hypothetical protein
MGFFTTGPTTADELAAQNNQPLAQPNIGADEMSSTTSLQGNDLARQLSQAVRGTGSIPGGFQGYSGNGFGGDTGTAQPYSPYSTGAPDLSGANSFNYGSGGNSVSNPFSGIGSSNFSYGSGGNLGYNTSFLDNFGGPNTGASADYWAGNRAFNFGDKTLGQTLGLPSWASDVAGLYGAATGNYDASRALGLSGNSAIDQLAMASGNPYLSLLNDDWSQRGMMSKGLQLADVPYASGVMGLMDYGQGVTNYGSLGSTLGGMLGGPLGAWAGGYLGNTFGGRDYNENWVGPSAEWAEATGYKQGTEIYDQAVDNFRKRQAQGTLTESQKGYEADWLAGAYDATKHWDDSLGEYVSNDAWSTPAPTNVEEAVAQGLPYGQEGDASWTPGGGQTFHSSDYNWNPDTNSGSDSFGNDISGGTDFSPSDGGSDYSDDSDGGDYGGYGDDSDDGGDGWSGDDFGW